MYYRESTGVIFPAALPYNASDKVFFAKNLIGNFPYIGKLIVVNTDKNNPCRFNWSTQQLCENMGLRR
uniref:hypothetical protein n=1 Tax=Escherichia coli TaxID=562 RepID=UPI001CDA60FE